MSHRKTALFSPAVNAQQQMPTEESQVAAFEQKFGQMAYQAFASKFPDLVNHVVTFKLLDSDLEAGTAVAAFIMETGGEYIYVPAVLSDNQLKPFDIMYVKSRDIFLPLDPAWIDEVNKSTLTTLGEGVKLPDTVSTDVDIRNIVVPPTTGRYSYASAEPSPYAKMHAAASEPLGRKLTKIANMMGGAPAGQAQMAGSGSVSEENYNPEIWATFVEQFQRIHQMTPGQALDEGVLDLETMAKMYKSHMKTWEMAQNPAMAMGNQSPGMQAQAQGAMNASQPVGSMGAQSLQAAPMPQGMAALPQKQANAATEGVSDAAQAAYRTWGKSLDDMTALMGRGGLAGAGTGTIYAASDREFGDIPGAALRGAVGGAIGAPVGKVVGKALAHDHPKHISLEAGGRAGAAVGSLGGGYLMAKQLPTTLSDFTTPSEREIAAYIQQNPDKARFLMRYGSANHDANLAAMIKHARAGASHKPQLLNFLAAAPNSVKVGFARVLERHPRLLKTAADVYGADRLVEALTPREEKTAGAVSLRGGGLYLADENTTPTELKESFGAAAPEAFTGIQVRGYAYNDTRKKLRLAVQVQHFHDFHDCRESGVYRLYNTRGVPKPALVIAEPTPLFEDTRHYFPHNSNKVKRVKTRIDVSSVNKEPHSMNEWELEHPEPDVERSHKLSRLVILANGDYFTTHKLMGEQVTEVVFPTTSTLYKKVLKGNKAEPTKGKGCFITKRGTHYLATEPVELSALTTDTNGVVRGKISRPGTWPEDFTFVMDPRSTIGRPMRISGGHLITIPADWQWMPLGEKVDLHDYLCSPKEMDAVVLDALNSMGAEEVVTRSAGENHFSVGSEAGLEKKTALHKLATAYNISADAAEAMLKIAEVNGVCRAHAVTRDQLGAVTYRVKVANGTAVPMTPMGAPPAMQGGAPSAVDLAFQETMQGLQQQVSNLQGQLDVLMLVQQRAQQIEGGGSMQGGNLMGAPQDPSQAGQPQGQMPWQQAQQMQQMQQMQGQQMQDPQMQAQQMQAQQMQQMQGQQAPTPDQVAGQVDPQFLQNASQFQDANAFDAGAIGSLAKNPSLKSLGSQYSANLEDSVDDLGRTLLTLYMQEGQLKEQLGDDAFVTLETQLRDTFRGLGQLVLSLTHNTAMLSNAAS